MIVTKTPLRIGLIGGGTDLQRFIDKHHKGMVLNAAINLYTYIALMESKSDNKWNLRYSIVEAADTIDEIKNGIAREAIKYFDIKTPLTINFMADIPSNNSGLASSSSFAVSLVKALALYKKMMLTQFDICKIAHEIELKENPETGYQDTYGCGLPGMKLLTITKDNVTVNYTRQEWNALQLVPTNIERSSTEILKSIDVDALRDLPGYAKEGYDLVNAGKISSFSDIMREAWKIKRASSPKIIPKKLYKFCQKLDSDSGMFFWKLCGAGGGGHFLIFSDTPYYRDGAKDIKIDTEGVRGINFG